MLYIFRAVYYNKYNNLILKASTKDNAAVYTPHREYRILVKADGKEDCGYHLSACAPKKFLLRAHGLAIRHRCGKCQFVLVVYKHFFKCPNGA